MKFWEWAIFISGMMSALVADSSIVWCFIFALICCFSLLMANISNPSMTKNCSKRSSLHLTTETATAGKFSRIKK